MSENDRWTGIKTVKGTGRAPVGPYEDEWLPKAFTVRMTSRAEGLCVEVSCRYDGRDRIEVVGLTLDGRPITPTYLVRSVSSLLPDVVRTAAEDQPGAPRVGRQQEGRPDRKPRGEELKLVSAVYWWNYVTWGRPRVAVQNVWGLKPATSSYWIDRADEVHPLPAGRKTTDA